MLHKLKRLRAFHRGCAITGNWSLKRRLFVDPGVRITTESVRNTKFGNGVCIGRDCGLAVSGILQIGERTVLQPRVRINATTSISIGADCAISWDVDLLDSDFHEAVAVDGTSPSKSASVVIEDRVWIGVGAKVLKGVTIGHDSVVAAGAVVTKSVPPKSLVAGVPARVVRPIGGGNRRSSLHPLTVTSLTAHNQRLTAETRRTEDSRQFWCSSA